MSPDFDLERIGDEVEAYARPRVGPEDARDVRQDVLLKLVINQQQLRPGDAGRWAGLVAKNTVIDLVRRRSRHALPAGDDLPAVVEPAAGPAAMTVRREDIRLVLAALDRLPQEQAELLWDATVLELPRDQLAAKYQVSSGALQARLTRARAALRRQFVASGGSLSVLGVLVPLRPRLLTSAGAAAGVAAGIACALLVGPWLRLPLDGDEQPRTLPSPITQRSHELALPLAEPQQQALPALGPVVSPPPRPAASPTPAQPVVLTPPLQAGVVEVGETRLVKEHEEESFQDTLERCLDRGVEVSSTRLECRDY